MTTPLRAVVTGGSSGIGRATALELAERGFDVAITYRSNTTSAEQVVDGLRHRGRRAFAAQLDLAEHAVIPETMAHLSAQLGGVDVLVNNAGVNRRAHTFEETAEGWMSTLAVNLVGPWLCARVIAKQMADAGVKGRVVNVTSVLAFQPIDGGAAYGAAKSGLAMVTRTMALELAPLGIAVNSVAPGHTATPMNYRPEELQQIDFQLPVIPAGRSGSDQEIAEAIAFFATSKGAYTTGSSLLVDGGLALATGPGALQEAMKNG